MADTRQRTPSRAIAMGAVFIATGAFPIVVGAGAMRGDADPPAWVIAAALTIVGLMAVITGWIAFGRGPRHFTMTLIVPFLPVSRDWTSGEWPSPVAFGTGWVLMAAMFIACAVTGVRRIAQSPRGPS